MKRLIKSFQYAFQGLLTVSRHEANFRIQLVATILVVIAGCLFEISNLEWICILLTIGLVMGMECLNSAVEYLADFISPEKNEKIKKVKDAAAGAVLICAIAAAAVFYLIFAPKI